MKKKTALKTMRNILSVCDLLNETCLTLQKDTTPEEFAHYRRICATVIGSLDLDILARIYKMYPELEALDHGLHPPDERK